MHVFIYAYAYMYSLVWPMFVFSHSGKVQTIAKFIAATLMPTRVLFAWLELEFQCLVK